MPLTRRQLLRASAAAAGVLAMGLLPGCRGLVRDDLDDALPPSGTGPHLDPLPAELLRWASLAPSGHNAQPWRVRLAGPERVVLGIDPARRLPSVDPDDHETLLGLGAFVENFVLAAGERGFEIGVDVLAERASEVEIVALAWQPGPAREYPLDRLALRRTRREGYASRALRPEATRDLVAALDGHVAVFEPASPSGRMIRDATIEANRLQAARAGAQVELAEWMRWRDAEARHRRDGLTPDSMEIGGFANWWVRSTYSRSTVFTPGFARAQVETTRRRANECAAWFVLTGEDDSVASLLETGRRFERMALRLGEHRVAAHPMMQMLEEPSMRGALGPALGLAEAPRMILRLGNVDRPSEPVSLRRPVEWFVVA